MSATVLLPFAGGEMSSFDPLDSACYEDASHPGLTFDTAYARCAILVIGASGCNSPLWSSTADFWFHGRYYNNFEFGAPINLQFFAGATEVMRVTTSSAPTFTYYTLQSGVLTLVGTLNPTLGPTPLPIDIELVAGASGAVRVYLAGTKQLEVTGLNHSGFSGVTQISLRGSYNSSWWTEIICDNQPHIGDRLKTFPIDSNSATNTGWTGTVGNINEIVYDDAAFISAATANLISTFYASGLSLGTLNILALVGAARAKKSVSGPANLQLAVRTGGSNYTSPSIALDVGFQACTYAWTTNPHTTTQWVAVDAQAAEGGVKSIT